MVKVLEDQSKLLSSPSVKGGANETPLMQQSIAKRGSLPPELPSMTKSRQMNVNVNSSQKRTLNGDDLRTNPYTDLVVTSFQQQPLQNNNFIV